MAKNATKALAKQPKDTQLSLVLDSLDIVSFLENIIQACTDSKVPLPKFNKKSVIRFLKTEYGKKYMQRLYECSLQNPINHSDISQIFTDIEKDEKFVTKKSISDIILRKRTVLYMVLAALLIKGYQEREWIVYETVTGIQTYIHGQPLENAHAIAYQYVKTFFEHEKKYQTPGELWEIIPLRTENTDLDRDKALLANLRSGFFEGFLHAVGCEEYKSDDEVCNFDPTKNIMSYRMSPMQLRQFIQFLLAHKKEIEKQIKDMGVQDTKTFDFDTSIFASGDAALAYSAFDQWKQRNAANAESSQCDIATLKGGECLEASQVEKNGMVVAQNLYLLKQHLELVDNLYDRFDKERVKDTVQHITINISAFADLYTQVFNNPAQHHLYFYAFLLRKKQNDLKPWYTGDNPVQHFHHVLSSD